MSFWRSQWICPHRSIWLVWRHIVSSVAWNGPLINLNPNCHLCTNHLCHSQRHLVFGEKMVAWPCKPPTCVPSYVHLYTRHFLWVSCLQSGHFLWMWHHFTYCKHKVYDQGSGRFYHPTFAMMVKSSSTSNFASCRFPFAPWRLTTFLWSALFAIIPTIC